jgi:hypothetical protein
VDDFLKGILNRAGGEIVGLFDDSEKEPDQPDFPTLSHVLRFLREKGYKVKKSKLYQDRKKGLIEVRPDGSVSGKAALAYAASLEKEGGDRSDILSENADRKFQAEIHKIVEQTKSITLQREILEGKYIPRTDAIRQRVDQITVIQLNLRSWIDRKAGEWRKFEGAEKAFKIMIHDQLDQVFNDLAKSDNFRVEYFDETEEGDDEKNDS